MFKNLAQVPRAKGIYQTLDLCAILSTSLAREKTGRNSLRKGGSKVAKQSVGENGDGGSESLVSFTSRS